MPVGSAKPAGSGPLTSSTKRRRSVVSISPMTMVSASEAPARGTSPMWWTPTLTAGGSSGGAPLEELDHRSHGGSVHPVASARKDGELALA